MKFTNERATLCSSSQWTTHASKQVCVLLLCCVPHSAGKFLPLHDGKLDRDLRPKECNLFSEFIRPIDKIRKKDCKSLKVTHIKKGTDILSPEIRFKHRNAKVLSMIVQ